MSSRLFPQSINFEFLQRSQCVIGIALLLILSPSEAASQASCVSKSENWTWVGQSQELLTCRPNVTTVEDEDFAILYSNPMNSKVSALQIRDKKNVKFLPTKLSSTFTGLIAMHVWDCSVTSVEGHYFKGLFKLRVLSLAQNEIEHVAKDAFTDLVNLEDLGLNSNKIQFLHENIFVSLKKLRELYLGTNRIKSLPPKIFSSLVKIEFIELRRNKLLLLNKHAFDDLPNLKSVDLVGNLCISERYNSDYFDSLERDLDERCNENSSQEEHEKTLEVVQLSKRNGTVKETSQSSPRLTSMALILSNIIVMFIYFLNLNQ